MIIWCHITFPMPPLQSVVTSRRLNCWIDKQEFSKRRLPTPIDEYNQILARHPGRMARAKEKWTSIERNAHNHEKQREISACPAIHPVAIVVLRFVG
mmetsp:Transcript_832/g.2855  ORF Transcript_832/g.2855 Transcript_832/m.2855 type:complete len:97 (-) Transcript_832:19-309(-)